MASTHASEVCKNIINASQKWHDGEKKIYFPNPNSTKLFAHYTEAESFEVMERGGQVDIIFACCLPAANGQHTLVYQLTATMKRTGLVAGTIQLQDLVAWSHTNEAFAALDEAGDNYPAARFGKCGEKLDIQYIFEVAGYAQSFEDMLQGMITESSLRIMLGQVGTK